MSENCGFLPESSHAIELFYFGKTCEQLIQLAKWKSELLFGLLVFAVLSHNECFAMFAEIACTSDGEALSMQVVQWDETTTAEMIESSN